MEHKFWIEKWKENQIHFHKQEINPLLIKYLNYIKKDKNRTSLNCLVPLCGKSLDMLWLQENLGTVLGIELSQLALDQFWEENQITPRPKKLNSLNINQGNNITLICHDFLSISNHDISAINGAIDIIYDRASLIALPLELRKKYYQKIMSIAPKNLTWLLITLEYDNYEAQGPPFSIQQSELKQYLSRDFSIELLDSAEIEPINQKFKKANIVSMKQNVYCLTKL